MRGRRSGTGIMALDEFGLIRKHFSRIGRSNADLRLGIGDDAAVVAVPPGQELVLSLDTLGGGTHFDVDVDPADLAHKALHVNLSDLAAMAATPTWFLLSLTLPEVNPEWLQRFSDSLGQVATQQALALIGGDTCRGPLSISVQIAGLVPAGEYVTRAGARVGDLILVSGGLGLAALGLAGSHGSLQLPPALAARCAEALHRPCARLELAPFLRRYASAAIDISDGLLADLGHVLEASDCGALLEQESIPVDPWLRENDAIGLALGGGDDYQICCCIAPEHVPAIDAWNRAHPDCRLTRIGEITASGYRISQAGLIDDVPEIRGYDHFGQRADDGSSAGRRDEA